jgi:vacuolar-type H+-ATPase subunit H
MTEIRQLTQVERGVEEALRNFAGRGANGGGEVPEITAAERIDKIGNMSALAIVEASETTAKDIEEAGQAAVDIAADIMEEAQQLATELRENGKKMSEHLKEFATLAKKVSTAMRDTRAEVLNPPEEKPPPET